MTPTPSDHPSGFLKLFAQRPMTGFAIWSVVAMLVSLFAYWAIVSNHWPGVLAPNQNATALVDTLLGPAIGLGGALVAIMLAAYAVRLQEREQRRVLLQAQVEMLTLVSEQTSTFLIAYARCLVRIRKFIGHWELHDDVLTAKVSNHQAPQNVAQFGQAMFPLIKPMTKELYALADELDELHVMGCADPFSTAIYDHSFRQAEWRPDVDPSIRAIPMNALPSIALFLRKWSARVDDLMIGPNGPLELGTHLLAARGVGAGCLAQDGITPLRGSVRAAIMQGVLFDDTLTSNLLGSGQEVRSPLAELLMTLMEIIDAHRMEAALRALFRGNEPLVPVIAQVAGFMPDPLDPELKRTLTEFRHLRPRLKIINGQFV